MTTLVTVTLKPTFPRPEFEFEHAENEFGRYVVATYRDGTGLTSGGDMTRADAAAWLRNTRNICPDATFSVRNVS